jgi:hypothetical protein
VKMPVALIAKSLPSEDQEMLSRTYSYSYSSLSRRKLNGFVTPWKNYLSSLHSSRHSSLVPHTQYASHFIESLALIPCFRTVLRSSHLENHRLRWLDSRRKEHRPDLGERPVLGDECSSTDRRHT